MGSRISLPLLMALCLVVAGCGPSPSTSKPPLLNRPTLLEDQEAMPELRAFDAQTPTQAPDLGAPLGAPSAPPLGQGGLLGQ